jgi:DUF1680 family protein
MLIAGCESNVKRAGPIKKVISEKAQPLPLTAVRLTGGPLKHAQDLDAKYLLELDPNRMLAYYRKVAGLEPKAKGYGGWDGGGRNLTGHIAGHYLSAVSLMYEATGDKRFKDRADYIVKELKEVQDKNGDGYLVALEKGRDCFGELAKGNIRSGGFDLNGQWSPWYTLHKMYAGLRDAYRLTGNKTALEVEIKFAQWAEGILSGLNDEQIQRMLNTEFGGMNEVMIDLYEDTGNKRWLDLSYKFEHRSFTDPLKRHQDNLDGKHGNTQFPKMIGSADRYVCIGDGSDLMAASFFWDEVAQHHSYATGGNGMNEYFGRPDMLSDRVNGRTAESCNVYNMLKLTRQLFALWPDAHYADFEERALFNHVLGSIDPTEGWTCYMVPVGMGVQHEYEPNMTDGGFTCCVGSGMESHALHGYGIYYVSGDKMWVNFYTPSTADWAAEGVKLAVDTNFPEGETAKIKVTVKEPKEFTLAIRKPYWAGDKFSAKVNGAAVEDANKAVAGSGSGRTRQRSRRGQGRMGPPPAPQVSTYIELKRTWKSGDVIELKLPKTLRLEATPDNPRRAAIMWGPLVLAGDLGPEMEFNFERPRNRNREEVKVPVFIAAEKPVAEWLKPVAGKSGEFRTDGVGRTGDVNSVVKDVNFMPFYRLHRRNYGIYWDLFTKDEWTKKAADYAAEQQRQQKLKEATVAFAQPGEMQPERDFNYQGAEDAAVERIMSRAGRSGRSWFSFDLPVEKDHPMALVVTYHSGPRVRQGRFEILVDDKRLAEQEVAGSSPAKFFDVEYAIPAELVKDKEKVTVKFQAAEGNEVSPVFGIRMIRGDAKR